MRVVLSGFGILVIIALVAIYLVLSGHWKF